MAEHYSRMYFIILECILLDPINFANQQPSQIGGLDDADKHNRFIIALT